MIKNNSESEIIKVNESPKNILKDIIPKSFTFKKNRDLILSYLSFRLNPKESGIPIEPISIARCKKIAFSLKKIDNDIQKEFSNITPADITKIFDSLKSGTNTRSKRITVEGDIPFLRTKVPYSPSTVRNLWSDFSNFWNFLVRTEGLDNILIYIKKP